MPFSAIADQISFIGRKKRQHDVFWDLVRNQTRFFTISLLGMSVTVMMRKTLCKKRFSGHLQTVDEVVAYSIANHLDTSMEMAFQAGEIRDVGQWFSQRLGYTVRLPNLKNVDLFYHFTLSFLSDLSAGFQLIERKALSSEKGGP